MILDEIVAIPKVRETERVSYQRHMSNIPGNVRPRGTMHVRHL